MDFSLYCFFWCGLEFSHALLKLQIFNTIVVVHNLIWWYCWVSGEYSFNRLHINGIKKYEKFGPIVREEIIPGVHLVLLFNPNDIERMYQVEGKYPSRRSHTALEFYRLNNPEFYNTGGLLPTCVCTFFNIELFLNWLFFHGDCRNGPEWHRLRVPLQRPINVTENIRLYVSAVDYVAGEFVEDLARSITQNRQSPDFLDDLSRVFMECECWAR